MRYSVDPLAYIHARSAGGNFPEISWRACINQAASARPRFRSKVNYPVGAPDHIRIVLDHNNGVALFNQSVEGSQQFLDIMKMKPGCGFIKYK